MVKFFLRNMTRYVYRLTDIQGGGNHFGVPSMMAISAETPKGNEIEISEKEFVATAGEIYKLTKAGNLQILVRDGNREAQATFDEVWKSLDKSWHDVWSVCDHPKNYREFRRRQAAGQMYPGAPIPSATVPQPPGEFHTQAHLSDVLPQGKGFEPPIPPTPPAVNPGPPQGQPRAMADDVPTHPDAGRGSKR